MKLRVLVVDDSILFRRELAAVLATLPDVEVVGQAGNGKVALLKIRELKPDLVTLDLEMPEMDGIETLEAIRSAGAVTEILVVSARTRKGGELTMRALERGAFDFLTKPEGNNASEARARLERELLPRIRALTNKILVRKILRTPAVKLPAPASVPPASVAPASVVPPTPPSSPGRAGTMAGLPRPELLLIGVSTGGPAALTELLPTLPADLGVPVLVVQHMPAIFTKSLAESLSLKCSLKVCEASHGQVAVPGMVYIAPGGMQMRVTPGSEGKPTLEITDDPPENNCRPAVDYLFRSAARHFPGKSLAVILTGMGADGTLGLKLLKRHGCFAIAQDEASCVVYGMPKAAVEAGVIDAILPLADIGPRILTALRGGL